MGALLALIPTRDWIYGGLTVILALWGWDLYHKYETAVNYQRTVTAESVAAAAAAKKTIDDNTAAYSGALQTIEAQYAKDTAAASQQHNSDVARLRAAAARQSNPLLHSAPGSSATGSAGDEGFSGLGSVALGLADALRADDSALTACYADRNALTGK